jgi:hypothetical protein
MTHKHGGTELGGACSFKATCRALGGDIVINVREPGTVSSEVDAGGRSSRTETTKVPNTTLAVCGSPVQIVRSQKRCDHVEGVRVC